MQTGAAPHLQIRICPNNGQDYLIYNEDTKLELNSNLNKRAVTKMQVQSIGQNYLNSFFWLGWSYTCGKVIHIVYTVCIQIC